VIVDNAHLADRLSLDALVWAMRRLRAERVLAVFVARDDEANRIPESLRRMAAGVSGVTIQLVGLDVDDLLEMAGKLLSRHAAVVLRDHTLGNALYVADLLQEMPADAWSDIDRQLPAPRPIRIEVARMMATQSTRVRWRRRPL
jgi:hypothetical protein